MRRRRLLAVAPLVLAGCSNQSGDDARTRDPVATTTATTTATETVTPASFAVSSFSVTSIVEIGEPFALSVTVENSGETAGTFESTISTKSGTGEWAETSASVSIDVPAGESASAEYEMKPVQFKRPASYRLDATETVARTTFVGRELEWGKTYTLPSGVAVTVTAPTFPETYTYRTSDGERTVEPPSGEQWAVYTARAENTSESAVESPLMADLILHHGEAEYRGEFFKGDNQDQYVGRTLEPGDVVQGEIPCDVTPGLTVEDFRVDYDRDFDGGAVDVTWLSNPDV